MEWISRPATHADALRALDRIRKGRPGERGWQYDLDIIETVLRGSPLAASPTGPDHE